MFPIDYLIAKAVPNSLKTQSLILMLSNGHEARAIEITRPLSENYSGAYIEENINTLWHEAQPILMQQYHAATQRALDPVINSAIAAIYAVFNSQAEPSISEIFSAATAALADTPKLHEWNRLTAMLQSMNEADYRRFLALTILINMSKSGRG